MLYLLIDGDGHHPMDEATAQAKVWDIITNNEETSFITSKHVLPSVTPTMPEETLPQIMMVIEVV